MSSVTLKQLEAFVAVAEHGSFSRAAESVFLSQSTLSAHVSELSNTLGRQLFVRENRHYLRLTPEGERVYPIAKRILFDCGELTVLFEKKHSGNRLLLGASTVPSQCILPSYIEIFKKEKPDTRFEIRGGDSAEIHRLLKEGAVRIGFVGAVMETDGYAYIPVADDKLVLITQNNTHFKKLKKHGALGRNLLNNPMIVREDGSGTDRTLDNYLSGIGNSVKELDIAARVNNLETQKQMVKRGVGVAVMSELAAEQEVISGELLKFEMDEKPLCRKIYMVYKNDISLSDTEQAFVSRFVKED
ncbi:MAG: LysR family transcriptional regulator [Clostridiales bacterium]|nr:LysR family transcriptional regulator [Clostridiales bacterium]